MLERGRAHPILGPLVLILLVLLLAMVFLHAAHDGDDGAAGIGGICIAIASFLGLLFVDGPRRGLPAPLAAGRRPRGPPGRDLRRASAPLPIPTIAPSLPLRR